MSRCPLGFTEVCENLNTRSLTEMASSCPRNRRDRPRPRPGPRVRVDRNNCTCLPTSMVEQDIEAGVNPLGRSLKDCVKVEQTLMFPQVNGKVKPSI